MPDVRPIAVTGASGAVGARVAARLTAAGAPLRLVVRDAERAPRLPGAQVRVAAAYGDAEAMRAALEGVSVLFLVPAHESPDRVAQHHTAIDAAVAAGVERIVYLSFLGAAPGATFTFARDHAHTEAHLRASGLPWTFLRMSLYLDFFPSMVGTDGAIRGPAGDGRVAAVTRDDVAAAVAAVLLSGDDTHDRRTYTLTGPEAFTLTDAAERIGRVASRTLRFEDETDAEAYASRAPFGAPPWEVDGWVSSYLAIRDGSLAEVSPDVELLTGQPPTGLEAFLATHLTIVDALRTVVDGGRPRDGAQAATDAEPTG